MFELNDEMLLKFKEEIDKKIERENLLIQNDFMNMFDTLPEYVDEDDLKLPFDTHEDLSIFFDYCMSYAHGFNSSWVDLENPFQNENCLVKHGEKVYKFFTMIGQGTHTSISLIEVEQYSEFEIILSQDIQHYYVNRIRAFELLKPILDQKLDLNETLNQCETLLNEHSFTTDLIQIFLEDIKAIHGLNHFMP